MKVKDTKQTEAYHAWSYQGIVNLPLFDGYVFNHGTESKANDRTAQHKNDCSKQSYLYEVIYENNDRVFGDKVISKSNDTDYVQKVAERLNNTILKNSTIKAQLLHEWFESISYLVLKDQRKQGDLNALRASNLSQTECIFVPNIVSRDQLFEARDYVNAHWYFNNKALLVSAKPYKDKNAKEKKMAAKPIPRAFHRRIIEALKAGKNFAQLLKYKFARIQGIELAYLISCLSELRNLEKIRVIITANDIEEHRETYAVLEANPKFELIECDSDEAMVEEYKMNTLDIKPDLDVMNPPYDVNLHLDILETVLELKPINSTVVSIQPARWLEDPLAEYKQGTDYKKYKNSVADKISKLQLIRASDATTAFHIDTGSDLGIYTFNNSKTELKITTIDIKSIINKILNKTNIFLNDIIEQNKVEGWRCEIKEMLPEGGSHSAGDSEYPKTCGVKVVLGPYYNGLDKNGILFSEARSKNGREKDYFRFSKKFNNEQIATNFAKSHQTNFYKNLIQLMKYDQHAPLRFLPYMGNELNPITGLEGYESIWTNEAYCKFFGLTQEESEFMCRKVDDYRVKDFINYITLN